MSSFIIETERLLLRPLEAEDAEAVFQWVGDERVSRYMVYNTYTEIGQVRKWLASLREPHDNYNFGFVRKEDGLLIGSGDIGPSDFYEGYWAFGYNFRHDCWGKGYATEAAKAMMRFAAEKFGITRFCSSHVAPNTASGHVMEKCGLSYVRDGHFTKLDGSCPMVSKEYEGTVDAAKFPMPVWKITSYPTC